MARIILKGGILADRIPVRKADISISGGTITAISDNITPSAEDTVIDIDGKSIFPSFADVHVHFREPGRPDKETILTGCRAAAHGGYTCVCTMPNLSPAPDSPEHLGEQLDIIRRDASIDVRPYATITMERAGRDIVDVEALKGMCAGFSDDGSGVQDDEVMLRAMKAVAAADSILAAHCEDNSLLHGGYIHDGSYARAHSHKGICSESEWGQIARDLRLAAESGCAYHVCHISTKESVALIRQAKAAGVNVTCETGPHYLALTEDDLQEDGRFKMNPPLRSREDRDALIEGLRDGTIDIIATDHAPHTAEEKSRGLKDSAMGVVGLETAFPVLYTSLVLTGKVKLERVLDALCTAPRKRFRLDGGVIAEGCSADLTVFDLDERYNVDSGCFLSKGHATPFEGIEVQGRCVLTLYKGNIVWKQ